VAVCLTRRALERARQWPPASPQFVTAWHNPVATLSAVGLSSFRGCPRDPSTKYYLRMGDSREHLELRSMADEVASAAGTPFGEHETDSKRRGPATIEQNQQSLYGFWTVTTLGAGAVIIALAMIAGAGWLF
jgi:hypothetical protein